MVHAVREGVEMGKHCAGLKTTETRIESLLKDMATILTEAAGEQA